MVRFLPAELVSELVSMGMPAPKGGVSSDDLLELLPAMIPGREYEDCALCLRSDICMDGRRWFAGYWSAASSWVACSPMCPTLVLALYYLLKGLLRAGIIRFPDLFMED